MEITETEIQKAIDIIEGDMISETKLAKALEKLYHISHETAYEIASEYINNLLI